jgi:hypothetical protein
MEAKSFSLKKDFPNLIEKIKTMGKVLKNSI